MATPVTTTITSMSHIDTHTHTYICAHSCKEMTFKLTTALHNIACKGHYIFMYSIYVYTWLYMFSVWVIWSCFLLYVTMCNKYITLNLEKRCVLLRKSKTCTLLLSCNGKLLLVSVQKVLASHYGLMHRKKKVSKWGSEFGAELRTLDKKEERPFCIADILNQRRNSTVK